MYFSVLCLLTENRKEKNRKTTGSAESAASVGTAQSVASDDVKLGKGESLPAGITQNPGTEVPLTSVTFPQITFQTSVVSLIMPKVEVDNLDNQRNALAQEKVDLKFKLNQLLTEKSDNIYTISLKDREILQRDKVIEQKDKEIEVLRSENESLKLRIHYLELEISKLQHGYDKLIAKDEFEKILVAIQDLNSLYRLEKVFKELENLRDTRVSAFHYIRDGENEPLKHYKAREVVSRLQKMSQGCKLLFKKNFGSSFLSDLNKVLTDNVKPQAAIAPLPDEKSEADDWWV